MVGLQAATGTQTMSLFLKPHLAVEVFYISFTMKKKMYAPITRLVHLFPSFPFLFWKQHPHPSSSLLYFRGLP